MHEDQFWLLVSLKLSGEATEEELASLEDWLNQFPERRSQLQQLDSIWHAQRAETPNARMLARHLQRLGTHTAAELPPSRRSKPWIILSIAASVVIVTAGLYLLMTPQKKNENTVMTKPGSKSKIQLPDGSQVWLNADSRLSYYENSREVRLSGEAFFDIAKDKDHPFIIHAASIDVKVLGTSLNIRSYSNEKNTEAVLIDGSIEVSLHSDPAKKIVLQPNQKIVVENNTPAFHPATQKPPEVLIEKAHYKQEDSTATEILWTKNKLAFDQETLEAVAAKIERWYNVKVTIEDSTLKHTEYSAVFEDESLQQVMEALRLTGNFNYSINKNEITITR